jgi:hypothetical protein
VVLPDFALDARVLQHKVLHVVTQPLVDYLWWLAPFVVRCRVAAVRQSYHRERVVGVLPGIYNLHFVAVLKAQRLVVPVQSMFRHEFSLMLLRTDLKFVLFRKVSSFCTLKANKPHKWIIEDIKLTAGYLSACEAKNEVQTGIILCKIDVPLGHLVFTIEYVV